MNVPLIDAMAGNELEIHPRVNAKKHRVGQGN